MGRILIILVALITMGTAANAATTLVSAPILGGPTQNLVVCYLYNAGNTAVSVSGSIHNHFLGSLPLTFNGCGLQPLAAGAFCNMNANPPNSAAYACEIVVSPSGTAVRGTLMIGHNDTTSGFTPLNTTELR
jgi:hypothetical protein